MSISGPERPGGTGGWETVGAPLDTQIESFARQTLGCQCPPEVFGQVAETLEPVPGLPEVRRRIAVGGRLLIQVVEPATLADALDGIGRWVRAGCEERDRLGLGRLRLVVVLDHPDAPDLIGARLRALAESSRLSIRSGFQLHCLSRADLPRHW